MHDLTQLSIANTKIYPCHMDVKIDIVPQIFSQSLSSQSNYRY